MTWLAVLAAFLSAVAAGLSAWTAVLAYRLQARIARSRKSSLRAESLLRNLQSLVNDFAEIHATAREPWSDKRAESFKVLISRFNHAVVVVQSLCPDLGAKIVAWHGEMDCDGNSVAQVVDCELGATNAIVGSKYDAFLYQKATELQNFRDAVYDSVYP